ncbi:MAG TPA: SAM-dependent methyltransferase, partial [Rhodospirillales bacterium]
RNPDHLLKSGELLALVAGKLQVVAYEHGRIDAAEIPGVKQRIAAVNDLGRSARDDGEPEPHPIPNS